jgi:metal-dependent amidase/aminoacylase/carboxypeptidase family protein
MKTKLLREAVETPSKDLLNVNKLKEFDQMRQQLGMQLVGTIRNDDGQEKDLVQGSVEMSAKVKEQSNEAVNQLKAAILKQLTENKSDTDKFNADANWKKETQNRLLKAFSLETCYQKHAYKIDENRLNNEKDLLSAKNSDEKFQAELKRTLIKTEVNNQLKLLSYLGEKMQDKIKVHTASVIESLKMRKSNEFAAMLTDTQTELKLDAKAVLNLSCKLE